MSWVVFVEWSDRKTEQFSHPTSYIIPCKEAGDAFRPDVLFREQDGDYGGSIAMVMKLRDGETLTFRNGAIRVYLKEFEE